MIEIFLIGLLSPSADGGAYVLTRAVVRGCDPDNLTRCFDGKSLPVTIMSAKGETYEKAEESLKERFRQQAKYDKALAPLKKMIPEWSKSSV